MSLTVCLAPAKTIDYPEGSGHLWVYLHWALALRALGCRVIWLEGVDPGAPGTDQASRPRHLRTGDPRKLVPALRARLQPFGLADSLALFSLRGDPLPADIAAMALDLDAATSADLLVNLWHSLPAPVVRRFRRSAFVDTDPGLLQIWMTTGDIAVAPHDCYFTIGETVGTSRASFPDCGLRWLYTPPPVYLPEWPVTRAEPGAPYTTLTHWWGGSFDFRGVAVSNEKRSAFLEYTSLPQMTSANLELAICLGRHYEEWRGRMAPLGWTIREAWDVSATCDQYRAYIQQSRGEFSCAKPAYVTLEAGWISDRTICYLASGKPAIVQHTGPSRFLPDADGLFRFRNLDEAARALGAAEGDYDRHCRAARALVEEHFDACRVVRRVLEQALGERVSSVPECIPVEHHTPATPGRTAAGADRIARLMADTLEDGLSRLQERSIRIRGMRRDVLQTSSSFRTERLHLSLDGGETLRVFFKDLNPEHLNEKARTLRELDLAPSRRELQMYQTVLSPQRFGTLHLYASRWEPERGIYWLFLEDGGEMLLLEFLEMPLWTAAARWAARFHAATRVLPPAQTSFLPQYDHARYQSCADRARLLLPALAPQERELVGRGLECYVEQIDRLCSLPGCVIHGQFFGKNILLPRGRSTPTVAVIDWETAALGPGTFDLVSLTFGKWTTDQRRAMQTAYLEQYQAETAQRIDEAGFRQELAAVALYQSLEWLAWWGHRRSLSGHFAIFMRELEAVLAEHFAAA